MTISLDNVAVQQFADFFLNEYQASESLKGTSLIRRGIVGDAYKWKVLGEAVMEERGAAQSQIPASDVTHVAPVVLMRDFALNLPTDIFQQAEVNADERSELAEAHGKSQGRRIDQLKIDALIASTTTNTVDLTSNLTVSVLREAANQLDVENVPPHDRIFLAHANNKKALLADTEATSSDFASVKALVDGDIKSFMGFRFIFIGNRREGGLPLSGNDRTAFAWHMGSLGMGFSIDPSVTVSFENLQQSFASIGRLKAGAITLRDNGIVKVTLDES